MSSQLEGAYDFQAEFVNPDDTYDFEQYKYQPLKIVLDMASVTGGTFTGSINKVAGTDTLQAVSADLGCFTTGGNKTHGYGMIQSVDEGFEIAAGTASFKLISFFARLAKMPVTTPPYNQLGSDIAVASWNVCDAAIDDLIQIFAQIPAWDELSDVGTQKRGGTPATGYGKHGSNYIWTQVIQGESIIEKLRLLAEANFCELFVDVEGRLIMEHWKDHRSPVDVVIPHELILSVSTSRSVGVLPSRIKVQGRPMSVIDMCGKSPMNENKKKNPGSGGNKGGGSGGEEPQKGKQTVCVKNGVANAHATLCQKIQKAGNLERNNAQVGLKDPKTYEGATGTTYDYRNDDDWHDSVGSHTDDERPVEIEVTTATDDGSGGENFFMNDGDHEVEVSVLGTNQDSTEWTGATSRNKDMDANIAEPRKMVEDTAEHLSGSPDPRPSRSPAEYLGGDWQAGNEGQYGDSMSAGGSGGDGSGRTYGGIKPSNVQGDKAGGGKGGAQQIATLNDPRSGGNRGGGSGGGGGGGGGGKGGKKDSNKNSNEPEDTRLECTVFDPDLQKEFGDTMQTVDNAFIVHSGQAIEIATRKFQRIRMGSRVFNLDIAYSPCIDVNKVVTFKVPISTANQPEDSDSTTTTTAPWGDYDVTGLVTKVSIDYDASPSVSMSIEVEPFYVVRNGVTTDFIGKTEYQGSNEIDSLCGMEV